MEKAFLDFYGVAFSVECPKKFAQWVEHDFGLFLAKTPKEKVFLSFKIVVGGAPEKHADCEAVFSNAEYAVFDAPGLRLVDFFAEAFAQWDLHKMRLTFFSAREETAYLKFYAALLTLLGKELDAREMHRIHCACLSRGRRAAIFLGEAGMGKTTLALNALKAPGMKLLSDEIVFVNSGLGALPFLTRIGIRSHSFAGNFPKKFLREMTLPNGAKKILVSAEALGGKISGPAKIFKIVLLRRSLSSESYVKPLSKLSVFWWLFKKSVFGSELVQEPAYFHFPGAQNGLSMLKIYLSRFLLVLKLCLLRKCVAFYAGTDGEKNLEAVERLLDA